MRNCRGDIASSCRVHRLWSRGTEAPASERRANREGLPWAASSHTASGGWHQWFPALSEGPSTKGLRKQREERSVDVRVLLCQTSRVPVHSALPRALRPHSRARGSSVLNRQAELLRHPRRLPATAPPPFRENWVHPSGTRTGLRPSVHLWCTLCQVHARAPSEQLWKGSGASVPLRLRGEGLQRAHRSPSRHRRRGRLRGARTRPPLSSEHQSVQLCSWLAHLSHGWPQSRTLPASKSFQILQGLLAFAVLELQVRNFPHSPLFTRLK